MGLLPKIRPWNGHVDRGELGALLVSAAFTTAGIWIAHHSDGSDRRRAIGVAAFFGLCLAIGLWTLRARRAHRRSAGATAVEIVGGVPFPARVGRGALLLLVVAGTLAVGAWALSGSSARWFPLGAALLCAGLVPVLLFGPPSRRAIVFEPEGLRLLESGWQVRIPWSGIADARLVDVEGTLVVAVDLRDPAALAPAPRGRSGEPALAQRRFARALRLNRRLYDCDLSVGPAAHGLDPVLFLHAVATYVTDRSARARLAPRPRIAAGARRG